ncbi:MAG: TIGR02757 family protein [Chitinophagaceae bacterium]|nr:MAG: TIGR02757 family protein [Chitinophagaceae bacterium]
MNFEDVKNLLDSKTELYNNHAFIENDPIQIPHKFVAREDIEISGFFAAIFSWGNRKTIINKSNEFLKMMDNAPCDFIKNFSEIDLKPFLTFKHRTFNADDALFFLNYFQELYNTKGTLEQKFTKGISIENHYQMEQGLIDFYNDIISKSYFMKRNGKHISTPDKNSRCKRILMFLRWMVRKDNNEVDFGIWNQISSSALFCPLDVHVEFAARRLSLISRKQSDWKTVKELTANLVKYDKTDPVKYDFALFNLSKEEKFR